MWVDDDITARARIRDAAMRQFGEHGFERSTIRGIAEAAGVSSGLVRHHFGSKEALREECDAHLIRIIRELNEQARADPLRSDVNYVGLSRATVGPYQPYLARALYEGRAATLFDEMVVMSEEWLTEVDKARPDPPGVARKVRATLTTAMALCVAILHQHVSRGIGVEVFSEEGDALLAKAMVDIYSHPLLSLEDAQAIQAAIDTQGKSR